MGTHCDSQSLKLLSVTALAGIAAFPSVGWAQTATAANSNISQAATAAGGAPTVSTLATPATDSSDIIVTANRRAELSQKVGISITAVSGAALTEQNVLRSEDLGKLVPGLNATSASGSSVSSFIIRGVGQSDFGDHEEQPNASYQDGVYVPVAAATGFPLFDLQRVEVLRGPQGTLFGRNATGGLIQYVSNQPAAGTSGQIEGALGERDLRRVQGFINAGTDTVAGRLAYFYQDQKGYLKNIGGRDEGDKKVFALRGQLRLAPTDRTVITIRGEGFNQNGTAFGNPSTTSYVGADGYSQFLPDDVDAYGTGPGNDFYGYRNRLGYLRVSLNDPGNTFKRVRSIAGTVTQDLGGATLTSVTSYGYVHNNYREDTDYGPVYETTFGTNARVRDFQQELRISGGSGPLRYTAGAFYFDVDGHYSGFFGLPTLFNLDPDPRTGTGAQLNIDYRLHTRSEAVYGQLEYDLSPKLTAILGGRYTWDQLDFTYLAHCDETAAGACAALFGADGVKPIVSNLGTIRQHDREGDWSGKAQLNFTPTQDVLVYASASKGVKSAGYSAPTDGSVRADQLAFKPEHLYAYELGVKSQLFDRRLTFNTSAYYYDYKDFQTFQFSGVSSSVLNRNATAYGGEVELAARPGHGFTANLGVAYNHFLVHDIVTPEAPDGENQRPVNAPRLQLNWGFGKTIDLTGNYTLRVDYSGRRISQVYYNIVNAPVVRAPDYSVQDFTIRLDNRRGWWISAYLNNAFDEHYQVSAFDLTSLGYSLRGYGEPRTFSAALGFKF